ncbi:restriction endonuclease subunit S [Rhodocyclus purpureus]|uniref:restriction endonuclease subunit S n=1 Tax=Rhodocyclus purpureus TaxID=1067 RepID=UPI001F5D9762|nr:restriction endonuclease subunit S [Rhodocyclus purpureus]MBK5915574.1 hypothetical protein [Rhodocyclus purpureus]
MELPAGWAQCEIGEVARIVSGGTPPSKDQTNFTSEGGIPWVTPADLSGYRSCYISRGARNLSEKGYAACSAAKLPAGSVLFSSRAPIGYVAIAANEISTNQGFKSFVLPEGFSSGFVYYYLKHIKPVAEQLATGTTFKELSGTAAAKLPFVVAPLAEQKRIAGKLDTVLAKVNVCRERLDRVPVILKRFRQSLLGKAISGQLTEEWRAENNGGDWQQTDVQSVAQVGTGSTPLRSNPSFFVSTGTPWVTSAATSRALVTQADEFVTESAIAAHRLRIYPPGTLLVAMYGEGKTRGQVTELGISAAVNQACAAVIVDQAKALTAYVKLVFQANYLEMRALAEGGNQPNLNLSKVKEFPLHLPSIEEQAEIVRRVDSLFAWADRLEVRLAAARTQADRLTPALLAKAFRGELVPQDPADEPAVELLTRIMSDKSAAPPQRQAKKSHSLRTAD